MIPLNSISRYWTIALVCVMLMLLFSDLLVGGTNSKFSDLWLSLTHYDPNNMDQLIMREFRIPRAITACLAGAALSVCGLLMQTMFNNPLAGPYVLGISSGSSLFVALGAMTGLTFFHSDPGNMMLAFIGAAFFGALILSFARWIRSQVSLLLAGLMLGSASGAIISVLEATAAAQELRSYTMWTMGSLSQTTFSQLPIFLIVILPGLLLSVFFIKPLNALLLGEDHAALLGIRIKRFRSLVILTTALLTGTVTAFCGPIAFVGLAVPNLTKMLLKTASHGKLLIGCGLLGAIFLLFTDLVTRLIEPYFLLPLNAFTTLIGAPVVIVLIIKRWS